MHRVSAVLILISLAVTLTSLYFQSYASRPLSLQPEEVNFQIKKGMNFKQITQQLMHQGLIEYSLPWEIYARFNKATNNIHAGEYSLSSGLTPAQLLDKLVKGDTLQFTLTVIEGWTFKQLWEAVKQHEKLVQTINTTEELLEALNLVGVHPEGLFYPDTYHFPSGTTDVDFFARAYEYMNIVLEEEWPDRDEGLPIQTPQEALTLASIIEKETSVESERDLVAAVFVTRLKRGMRLQTDPTVIYGMGDRYTGNIRKKDLKTDTPYNTYVHKGLPPTPIALPSRASIAAALSPAANEVLYFVSKGDGTHHFSKTYEEHREAVIKYQLGGNSARYRANHEE